MTACQSLFLSHCYSDSIDVNSPILEQKLLQSPMEASIKVSKPIYWSKLLTAVLKKNTYK